MNENELTASDAWSVRLAMRQTLQQAAQRMQCPLEDAAADLLYLEASTLIPFDHAPMTTMHVAHTLLGYDEDQNPTGKVWFMERVKQCKDCQQVETLVNSLWE